MKLLKCKKSAGFTLIELLTVIAIIGILAGIIILVSGSIRGKAKKAKARAQFTQLALSLGSFKQEYGFYPIIPNSKLNADLARNATSMGTPARQMLMLELLSGRDADPSSATFESDEKNLTSGSPRAQNKKRVPFYTFSSDEILAFSSSKKAIIDTFGNLEIVVLVDRNGDGIITTDEPADEDGNGTIGSAEKLSGFPRVYSTASEDHYVDSSDIRDAKLTQVSGTVYGIRADVVIYSAGDGSKADGNKIDPADAVFSW